MLPLIVVVIIIFILIGAYQLGSVFVYRDRAVVRDALDSAVTSALVSGTVIESHDTNYSEEHIITYDHTYGYTYALDSNGNYIITDTYIIDSWETANYWSALSTTSQNNIYLNKETAETTAKTIFQKIISGNNIKATISSWNFAVNYDVDRYINVTQNRSNTSLTNWWAYSGSNGTTAVMFPRWVKVTITAKVSVPVLFGGILGKTTQDFTWKSTAVKELTPGSY